MTPLKPARFSCTTWLSSTALLKEPNSVRTCESALQHKVADVFELHLPPIDVAL